MCKGRARDVQGMRKGLFTWFGLQLAELVVLLSASSFCAVVLQQSEDFCSPPITVCVCVCVSLCHPCNKGLRNRFLQNARDCSRVEHVLAECTESQRGVRKSR